MVERSWDSIEKDVDAAICAANRVAKAGEKAKQLKDGTMQITAEDDWMRYKVSKCFLKRASEVMKEATTARDAAKNCWEDVHEATGASSGPVKTTPSRREHGATCVSAGARELPNSVPTSRRGDAKLQGRL